ncbi:hypothetical protein FN846DRAFT_785600 [Sphaerosporella brunnea]|uniref:Uncharacterized protein n=1 Tax=Sphaerosporella brunnea TaxID=1250544 RepID=A0A5J5EJ08_9PEZI|nr:hypothetical protein FN846DRAFT_785600 [Sphaerosporella brunnea]
MFPSFSRQGSDRSNSSSRSSSSSDYDSQSSKSSVPNSVPSLDHHSVESRFDTPQDSALFDTNPLTSVNTYCTTVVSHDDREHDSYFDAYDDSEFFFDEPPQSAAVPATPQEFAEHFPRHRKRLIIKHDDSTLDGNMNVRVAHVKRKFVAPPQRPTLRKALSSLRGKQQHEEHEFRRLERADSGYASNFDDEEEAEHEAAPTPSSAQPKATNTCALEFSNYAHVELTRRGAKSGKKYEFEYWGKSYSWRRTIKGAGMNEDVSYHLVNNASGAVVAEILPDMLDATTLAMEEAKGGFVPPCSMFINDSPADPVNSQNADVADVIVTTGLVALVDDSIKRKYQRKRTVQLVLPTSKALNMEYVGPKRFIDEMFHRGRPVIVRSQSAPLGSMSPTPAAVKRMFTL